MKEIPVYLFTGFLEAGKTKVIQETLEDENFNTGEQTLIITCAGSKMPADGSFTVIGEEAFYGNKGITAIILPDSVKSIGKNAFSNCVNLTSVEFGNGIEAIGERAFFGCESIEHIALPDSLKTLGNMAFAGCLKLENVTIEKGIESISSALTNCPTLENVTYKGTVAEWAQVQKSLSYNFLSAFTVVHCSDGDIAVEE